ncbi:MAG: EDD domain protein [Gracilibacter sp. BRH_c7a]|nr:MAG: EDD domain protein [Gracilibacter sp. BRH_c7a]
MAYRIVVDSSADLPSELAAKLGIVIIPMPVFIDGKTFLEGVEIFPQDFYREFNNYSELPKTSQPNPNDVLATYEKILAEGDEVIAIHLSSGLSSTYQSAIMVRDMCSKPDKVHVFDSLGASLGFGLQAILINEVLNQYNNWEDLEKAIITIRDNMRYTFTLDTLEYLVKGGRVSRTAGFVGSLLDVKPILHINSEGKIDIFHKVRSRKASIRKLISIIEQDNDKPSNQIIGISHAACPEDADYLAGEIRKIMDTRDIIISDIGCVVGSHVGPGTITLFYQSNSKNRDHVN